MAPAKSKKAEANENSKPIGPKNQGSKPLTDFFPLIKKKSKSKPVPRFPLARRDVAPATGERRVHKTLNYPPKKDRRNFQGFPLDQCWFCDRDSRFYYVPHEYVKKWPRAIKLYKEECWKQKKKLW